jgi:outer membrane usher protein
VAGSRRLSSRRARLGTALALVLALAGPQSASEAARERLVEVRAGGRVVARAALLLEHPEHGRLLRLRDLAAKLPHALPRLKPIRLQGEPYLPLAALGAAQIRLDQAPGVLELGLRATAAAAPPPAAGPAPAVGLPLRLFDPAPAPAPPLPAAEGPPGDGGLIGELLALPPPGLLFAAAPAPALAPEPVPAAAAAPAAAPPAAASGVLVGTAPDTAGTPYRRRDPLDLPLLDQDAWQEWLVSVVVNGATLSEGAVALRAADGRWAARVIDLRHWRLRLDEALITTYNGEPFYLLDAIPGLSLAFDQATLTLTLVVPAGAFETATLTGGRPSTLKPEVGRGAFFDYDLLLQGGGGIRERLDALLEFGVFDKLGVLVSDFRAGDVAGGERELVRLDSSFTKDLPERRASLRLGDAIVAGGALGRPVRFAGIQFASNFATDPTFVTFPLPSIGGLAEQASVAELFLDNALRVSQALPAGPFEIDNLPVVTGAGEVQLKVTDLLGREQLITQSFYVSPRLLRAGLAEYGYQLGFERERFNLDSFDYGRPLLAGSHRYGLTDAVTAEGLIELTEGGQAAGLGGALLLGDFGLISAGLLGSHDDDAGAGYGGFIDYEYRARSFNVGLRSRYDDADFRQLGQDFAPPARTDQLSFGVSLEPFGRIGTFLINTEARTGEDLQSVAANYSLPLGSGALLINAIQTLDPDEQFAIAATYAMPLSPTRSLSATVSHRDEGEGARVQYSRGRGASDLGPSYRLATELGDSDRPLDLSARYDFAATSAQLDATMLDDDLLMRANLAGSLAYVDGDFAVSRRLGRAFGMVALPGHPDVTVYLENREAGRTDESGKLFLPQLNPYQENRVRVRAEDLPLDSALAEEELVAVPYDRAGLALTFDVTRQRSALARLVDSGGTPLPAGLVLTGRDGTITAQVAERGTAYITGADGPPVELASAPGQPAFRCALPALPDEPVASLGEIRCMGG